MVNFVVVADPKIGEREETCNCDPCRRRRIKRAAFQQRVCAHVAEKCPNVPVNEVWQCSVVLAAGCDALFIPYDELKLEDQHFYSLAEAEAHPEIIDGTGAAPIN